MEIFLPALSINTRDRILNILLRKRKSKPITTASQLNLGILPKIKASVRKGVYKIQSYIQFVSTLVAVSVPGGALQACRDLSRLWPVASQAAHQLCSMGTTFG